MRAMKDSGVEWLGKIPIDWEIKPLWSIYRRVKRTGFPEESLLSVYRDHGVIPKSSREDNHNVESLDLSTYQLVEPSDLAVNKMKAWQGSLSVSSIRGIVSPAYFIYVLETQRVHTRYIHHLLRSDPYVLSYLLSSKGVRIGQWDLQPEIFRRTPVVLPPIEDQEEISRYIDQETDQIDLLISKKEKLIEKLLERRQALITHVVTKGLDPNLPMQDSGVEWLGKVVGHWTLIKLGRLLYFFNGRDLERSDTGKFPIYGSGGIFGWSDVAQYPLHGPSILFGRKGTINRPLLVSGPFSCVDTMYWTQLRSKAEIRYIFYLSTIFPYALLSTQTALPSMTSGDLKAIKVPLPPFEEQESIASHLDEETSQIDTLVANAKGAIELLKERRQALITQVVTGKIDVRGFAGGNS